MSVELGQGTGPLRGVKVVEIAGIGPGPHACMILADLGADVIRIERPGGQLLTGGPTDLLNRGRPSVALDLKNPEAAAIERAGAEAVREALRSLPPDFREVIVLRELHELSYREIADITGIPIGTVMSRLSRGRKVLAAKIAGLGRRLETGT